MKENCFILKKARSRRYPTQTITDADYADDRALLTNTPTLAESLLYSLEQAAGGIGLLVNADKMEYMYFNQKEDISILNSVSLKLEGKFTFIGSSILSDLAKTWNDIDRLSIIWKSDLPDKIELNFFQVRVVLILQYGCTTWTLN